MEEGADAVLVTNTLGHLDPELEAFARRHTHTTRRAGRARVGPGIGPVLAYVPYVDDLEFAMDLARGSSLAVVETASFPLEGWARWLGAWDLVNDEASAPLPGVLAGAVDRLAFYGNNGFGDDFGKRQATAILRELCAADEPTRLLPSAVLAAGVSARGVAKLEKSLAKAA
ncbi:MAG: hypothetical protein ACRD0M_06630 [Acidimicrobiales bacterium]